MKLNKTVIVAVISGIFLIAMGTLGYNYYQSLNEQKTVSADLASAVARVNAIQVEPLKTKKADLQKNLDQLNQQLTEAKAAFSNTFASVNATSMVIDVADKLSLDVVKITTTKPTTETLDGVTYSAVSVTATVTGDVNNLINFVPGLNQYLDSGIVKSVKIDIPPANSSNVSSASVSLVAYTYQGGQ